MFNGMKRWFLSIAIKKTVTKYLVTIVAALMTWVGKMGLDQWGVQIRIDPDLLVASLYTGAFFVLDILRNYVKTKTGWKWL